MSEDPWGGPDEVEDDDFDTPQSTFVGIEHVDGRLIVCFPQRVIQKTSKNSGDKYDVVIADVIVIDGELNEHITHLPFLVEEMHISAGGPVSQLRPKVGKGKPFLTRVNSQPSQYNKRVLAYGFGDPTDADKMMARPAAREHMASDTFGK
jgi:hypothetical protein